MALDILLCKHICQRFSLVPILVGGSLYEKQLQFLSAFPSGADEWEGRLCWGKAGRLSCAVCLLRGSSVTSHLFLILLLPHHKHSS